MCSLELLEPFSAKFLVLVRFSVRSRCVLWWMPPAGVIFAVFRRLSRSTIVRLHVCTFESFELADLNCTFKLIRDYQRSSLPFAAPSPLIVYMLTGRYSTNGPRPPVPPAESSSADADTPEPSRTNTTGWQLQRIQLPRQHDRWR